MSLVWAVLLSVAGAIEYKSAEWYETKDAAWQQVGRLWPEAMTEGPFRRRMFELDEWAKQYNRQLFEDSEKPLRYARMVVEEQRFAKEQRGTESTALAAAQMSRMLDAVRESTHEEMRAAQLASRDRWLFALLMNPLAAVVGFWTSGSGLTRRGIWMWLIGIVGIGVLIISDSGLRGFLPILGGVFSGALGSRALNAGYPIWLAGIAGVPWLSLPLVAHLMFFTGRRKVTETQRPTTPENIAPDLLVANLPTKKTTPTMKLAEYRLGIPEAQELVSGYAVLQHGTHYSLLLANDSDRRCDVKVTIDGNPVGIWRVNAHEEVRIERPAEDRGRFTFVKHGTAEGDAANLEKGELLGLISAEFRPERPHELRLNAAPLSDSGYDAGGTGLTGKSQQRFDNVRALDFDSSEVKTIHIRLVSRRVEVRPLAPRSTPIPPPV